SLSTLLINLDLLESTLPRGGDALRSGFERIRELAQRTLDETRALSHALRPTILDDFGLIAALRWFADEFKQTFGIPVEVTIDGAPPERLAPERELALFRIAQEALTNSGKYADATMTRLKLSFSDTTVRLTVEDNGRGFDPEVVVSPTRHGGLGLYGMRERAVLVGAALELDSVPGRGTRITVVAPPVPAELNPAAPASDVTVGERTSL
ncbi:MAG: sensor histidine kinase, partial [Chloroflexota bacterium]